MSYAATITSNNQITLPKYIRELLGVSSGDTVIFTPTRDAITIQRAKTAEEVAAEIDKIISSDMRAKWKKRYAGKTATEIRNEWLKSPESDAYFAEELRRTL